MHLYVCEKCNQRFLTEDEALECENLDEAIDKIIKCVEFEITEQHLKLIRNQNVKFAIHGEYGAAWVDPKRPYGNSDAYNDILKILDMQGDIDEDDGSLSCSPELSRKLFLLHVETTIVLQICMALLTFETGLYTRGDDWIDGIWKKAI